MAGKTVVLAAGGTGGHVFPASSLGEQLLERGYNVLVFTDERGAKYNWPSGVEVSVVTAVNLSGGGVQKLTGIVKLIFAAIKTYGMLKNIKPSIVVGFGGFPSLCTMLGAIPLNCKLIVHQADAALGRANKVLLPFVSAVATSFAETHKVGRKYKGKLVRTGLPIRSDIKYAPYKLSSDHFRILITGGSQGAKFFGDVIPDALALLPESIRHKLVITHQCRPESRELVEAKYAGLHCAGVELEAFFDNMPQRYADADLIVSRSGASSVLESAAVGRPAIFVPYPFATGDHQAYNATEANNTGGAWWFRQDELTPQILADLLQDFMKSPWKLEEAAVKIRSMLVDNAAGNLANLVEDLIKDNFDIVERKKAA